MNQLSAEQINNFIYDGFVKIDQAFPVNIADECRAILWETVQCDPNNAATWIKPVIRIGELGREPFQKAANTAILHTAFDQLAGKGNWLSKETLGSFPVRFPSKEAATDTGWHVDASFPGDDIYNYMEWRINIHSKGRVLLMLFLFSDVDEADGPTIIRKGSHLDVARLLQPEVEHGLSFMELAQKLDTLPEHELVLATGAAGTVYLCHPFIVHAGQNVKGTKPKFMAQPALQPRHDFNISGEKDALCAVEKAIVKGIR